MDNLKFQCAIPKGRNQVGDKMELPANRRAVPLIKVTSPKITEFEDTECQGEKAMEKVKGWLAEWFGEHDILRPMAIRILFLATIN